VDASQPARMKLECRRAPRPGRTLRHPTRYSYGSAAAIVTSVGLIVGFGAASLSRAAILSGLLIIALADNLSDSLSIHIYQESENLEASAAFAATVTNFVARLLVALSFVGIVLTIPEPAAPIIATVWGLLLLATLTYALSRVRHVPPWREIGKHVVVAIVVVATSRMLGGWIAVHVAS